MAKYPWGDHPFPMPVFGLTLLWGVFVVATTLFVCGPDGAVDLDGPVSLKSLGGVALVTAGWVVMFYLFLGTQVVLNVAAMGGEYVDPDAKNIALRGMMNTLEQMGPFFSSLWLHAIFVNPKTSVALGWVYVVLRLFYTPLYGLYGHFTVVVEFSTTANYYIISYFLLAVAVKVQCEKDLHTELAAISPFMVFASTFGVMIIFQIVLMVAPSPIAKTITKGCAWDKALKGQALLN
eukprot:gnl/MRDRNA2_/MRDRNA2_94218_c0_seq1.p1 gnl/MRDRNA2_/MRDRNA2_94218_c0~~gnl/MRDRNA2_/MRDRNA2_94218_c0_seq1.p1  ORF type:complete len:235 (-),score=25.13 gnl/MRDRNA2_/MRDRNA2_94218_c0_seq1:571-1275(-)